MIAELKEYVDAVRARVPPWRAIELWRNLVWEVGDEEADGLITEAMP